jgi:hypothetical protein
MQVCTRLFPHCKLCSSPLATIKNPSRFHNGCELYFDAEYPLSEVPKSWLLSDIALNATIGMRTNRRLPVDHMFGSPVTGVDPHQFLGCGWSYWYTLDIPCLSGENDDRVFLLYDTFETTGPSPAGSRPLPLCESIIELMGTSNGR